jgi:hypothetical protein
MTNGKGAVRTAANDDARSNGIARHMEVVARRLLGEPNRHLSTRAELRFGTHGSLSVDLEKGTWFSHEDDEGGGVLDLIARETGRRNGEAVAWLRDELGIDLDDRPPTKGGKPRGKVTVRYVYRDEQGAPLYGVLRWQPKHFSQERYENGAWISGKGVLDGVRRVLYRLPELLAADPDEPVFVPEGEKDVDRLRNLSLVATTNPQGAGKWLKVDRAALAGRHVIVLPDNDDAGRKHAAQIVRDLTGKAASVRVLKLPGLPEKGDVSDWLADGGTAEKLREMAAKGGLEEGGWLPKLVVTEKGVPRDCLANGAIILRQDPAFVGRIRFDEHRQAIIGRDMPWRPGSSWRDWTDTDDLCFAEWCQLHNLPLTPRNAAHAVAVVANDHRVHPIREYLDGLKWDGVPRLDSWLTTYLGVNVPKDEAKTRGVYVREVGRRWPIAAVARIYKPGCKVDTVPILEGPQGALKSSALAALVPNSAWFTDQISDLGTKDAAQDLNGKWIIELAELSAMRRNETERIKAFVSRASD